MTRHLVYSGAVVAFLAGMYVHNLAVYTRC